MRFRRPRACADVGSGKNISIPVYIPLRALHDISLTTVLTGTRLRLRRGVPPGQIIGQSQRGRTFARFRAPQRSHSMRVRERGQRNIRLTRNRARTPNRRARRIRAGVEPSCFLHGLARLGSRQLSRIFRLPRCPTQYRPACCRSPSHERDFRGARDPRARHRGHGR